MSRQLKTKSRKKFFSKWHFQSNRNISSGRKKSMIQRESKIIRVKKQKGNKIQSTGGAFGLLQENTYTVAYMLQISSPTLQRVVIYFILRFGCLGSLFNCKIMRCPVESYSMCISIRCPTYVEITHSPHTPKVSVWVQYLKQAIPLESPKLSIKDFLKLIAPETI